MKLKHIGIFTLAVTSALTTQTAVFAYSDLTTYSYTTTGSTIYSQKSGTDSYGVTWKYMAGIGARDTGSSIYVYKIHHYSGSSSPQALYYGQTAMVDSVNSNNTSYVGAYTTNGMPLAGTDRTSDSFWSWTGNYAVNLWPYYEQVIGKAATLGNPGVSPTDYSRILLKPSWAGFVQADPVEVGPTEDGAIKQMSVGDLEKEVPFNMLLPKEMPYGLKLKQAMVVRPPAGIENEKLIRAELHYASEDNKNELIVQQELGTFNIKSAKTKNKVINEGKATFAQSEDMAAITWSKGKVNCYAYTIGSKDLLNEQVLTEIARSFK